MRIYVASSWRNPTHPAVVQALRTEGHDVYDFRAPGSGTAFSWAEVKTHSGPDSIAVCENCGRGIVRATYAGMGGWEPDWDPRQDPLIWRHSSSGYAACQASSTSVDVAAPKKGSDWESVNEYLRMLNHPRSEAGFRSDFDAMQWADAVVLVLPCGKSAHLELGWAVGAGKRTAILLEDPVEPELMYRMVDHLAVNVDDLLRWVSS